MYLNVVYFDFSDKNTVQLVEMTQFKTKWEEKYKYNKKFLILILFGPS